MYQSVEQLEYDRDGVAVVVGFNVEKDGELVEYDLHPSRAGVLADALNVHEATGLTPSQLQARVAELEAALREAVTLASTDDAVTAESDLWAHLCKWEAAK